MTRISSFSLYQCLECKQIHTKPEYGSVSIYIPTDMHIDDEEIKPCKNCGKKWQFRDYKFVGRESRIETQTPSKFELLLRKIFNKPYIEQDVRKIYPSIS